MPVRAMQPEPTILRARALTKSFARVVALNAVSLEFRRGEFFCLLGPSGCGKTTLLRLVAGLDEPTSGDIELEGRSPLPLPPERRPVNMVFQQYALFPHMTVFENVAFGLTVKKLRRDVVRQHVDESLSLVRLEGHGERYLRQLSGGSSSGQRGRGHWSTGRVCSYSTSRWPHWMRSCGRPCSASSSRSSASSGSRSST